jgi:hypothetical protein
MDDQNRSEYRGEEHFYNPQKIEPARPFWRRHVWAIVATVAIIFVIIFASTTILLLMKSSQNPTPPAQGSTSQSTQVLSNVTPTTSNPAATVVPTSTSSPIIQATPGLPCSVDIGTWTGGSPDWVVHNGILFNDGSSGSSDGPTIIAPCQPGATTMP